MRFERAVIDNVKKFYSEVLKRLDATYKEMDIKVEYNLVDFFDLFPKLNAFLRGDNVVLRGATEEQSSSILIKAGSTTFTDADNVYAKMLIKSIVEEINKLDITNTFNDEGDFKYLYIFNHNNNGIPYVYRNSSFNILYDNSERLVDSQEYSELKNQVKQPSANSSLLNFMLYVKFLSSLNMYNTEFKRYKFDFNVHSRLLSYIILNDKSEIIFSLKEVPEISAPAMQTNLFNVRAINPMAVPNTLNKVLRLESTTTRIILVSVFELSLINIKTCSFSGLPYYTSDNPIMSDRIERLFNQRIITNAYGTGYYTEYNKLYKLKELGVEVKNNGLKKLYDFKTHYIKEDEIRDEEYQAMSRVNNYSYCLPRFRFVDSVDDKLEVKTSPDRKLYIGAEFEYDDGGTDDDNAHLFTAALTGYKPFVWSTRDGSVSRGFESKTMPSTIEAHMNKSIYDYENAFRILKKLGYTGANNTSCGLHVHVSRSFFAKNFNDMLHSDRLTLALISSILERNWSDVVAFTRRTSDKIQQWAKNHGTLVKLEKMQENEDRIIDLIYSMSKRYAEDKYSAINANKINTFEFRIFRSTLNIVTFKATLQFVSNLSNMVKDIIDKIYEDALDSGRGSLMSTQKLNKALLNGFTKAYSITYDDIIDYADWQELKDYAHKIDAYNRD